MFVDQVRSRTSTCDSITIRFNALEYYNIHETPCQHLRNLFFVIIHLLYQMQQLMRACSLSLFALYFIQPYNTRVLGVAPLFVVLREESIERDRIP